jgi:hypothetical protein
LFFLYFQYGGRNQVVETIRADVVKAGGAFTGDRSAPSFQKMGLPVGGGGGGKPYSLSGDGAGEELFDHCKGQAVEENEQSKEAKGGGLELVYAGRKYHHFGAEFSAADPRHTIRSRHRKTASVGESRTASWKRLIWNTRNSSASGG